MVKITHGFSCTCHPIVSGKECRYPQGQSGAEGKGFPWYGVLMDITIKEKDTGDLYLTPLLQQTAFWSGVKSDL